MTHTIPNMNAHSISTIGTIIDAMLQQRVPVFMITFLEKKRIADPATLVSQFLHGATDPHFHAVAQYQIGTTVYPNKTVLTIEITYLEDVTKLSYVNIKVSSIIAQLIHPTMHEHQKLLALHDWITASVSYDHTLQRRTAYDALHDKLTVCSGYASLFWHLCHAVGIPCRIVTGIGKFEAHAWNMVQLDTHWYHIDTTWSSVVDTNTPFSVYRFYMLTDKEIQQTHRITHLAGQKPLPQSQQQYRAHLQQLGQATPRLRNTVHAILHKTGLIYLEPEYTVVGVAQLNTRIYQALHKQQTRVIFGYRGATVSPQHDIQAVLNDLKAQQRSSFSLSITLYPMPHGFIADSVLVDIHIVYP